MANPPDGWPARSGVSLALPFAVLIGIGTHLLVRMFISNQGGWETNALMVTVTPTVAAGVLGHLVGRRTDLRAGQRVRRRRPWRWRPAACW